MKLVWSLTLLGMAAVAGLQAKDGDPVVMKINGTPVHKSEFEYFYNKNNQQEVAEEKSFDEYVDLFINYKLKVAEALERGIDTTAAYRDELAGYRAQLAQPYLEMSGWQDSVVEEAIARRRERIDAAHILVALNENAPADQVKAAEAKILEYKAKVEAGASFDSLAQAVSEDPSARQNKGRLGYFSAMQMVYPFEDAAYNTPVGGLSVCRSRFGYHLIKVYDRQPAQGEVRVAHIMKVPQRGLGAAGQQQARTAIDSLYKLLRGGADFAQVARDNSDDAYTARDGGEYPWLDASAGFPREWLDAAFALEHTGDYTRPFRTAYGWHILRLLDKRGLSEVSEEAREQMKAQLSRDPERAAAARRKFLAQLSEEYQPTIQNKVKAAVVALTGDTAVSREAFSEQLHRMKKPLLKWDKKQSALPAELADYVVENGLHPESMDVEQVLTDWTNQVLLGYEDARLEEKYTDFRNLYHEYHDGILLFDVASGEVWDKAAADTVGLNDYFNRNRSRYGWEEPRFKGAFVECADDSLLIATLKDIYAEVNNDALKASELVRARVLTDSTLVPNTKKPPFHIVNGIFARGDNEAVDVQQLKCRTTCSPKPEMPVVMTFGKVLPDGPECADDVRGTVVADYQTELEERWVAQLREKYTWQLNEKELDKLRK
jgi:peptidyl-prolyl cis-trans isomerase SurA